MASNEVAQPAGETTKRAVRSGLQNTAGFAIVAAIVLPIVNQFIEPDLNDIQLLALAGAAYTGATLLWNWLEENTAFPRILKGNAAAHVCPPPIVDRIDQENWDTMGTFLHDLRQDMNNGFSQVLNKLPEER
jgi:hypothetical protein